MKFVHLTAQPYIGLLRKNGIHIGNGRQGRGVYAVPLVRVERQSFTETGKQVMSDAHSIASLWRWLFKLPRRRRHAAAIVFKTGREHWPADVYLLITPDVGLQWISQMPPNSFRIDEAEYSVVAEALKEAAVNLRITVQNIRALGILLHHLRAAGFKTFDHYDESIEIVFRSPIKPRFIERIVPLYQTSKHLKRNSPSDL